MLAAARWPESRCGLKSRDSGATSRAARAIFHTRRLRIRRCLRVLPSRAEQWFSAAEGVRLTVQTHFYSPLNVGVGVEFADIVVRVVPDAESPLANDDAFRVRSTTEATLLDVLVNDVPVVDGPLELVDVAIEGHSESEVSIDAATGAIRYRPQQVFMGFERLFYKVRNAAVLGVVDGGPEPRLRGRIRGVATG